VTNSLTCGLVGAFCGGAFDVQRMIGTGDPAALIRHAAALADRATQLGRLRDELAESPGQLAKVWQGPKSAQTRGTLQELVRNFGEIITTLNRLSQLLQQVAGKIRTGQQVFSAGIAKGSQVIQAILSSGNPGAKAAAHASARATTSTLQQAVSAIGRALTALGAKEIGAAMTAVGDIMGQVEQLTSSFTGAPASTGAMPAMTPSTFNPAALPSLSNPTTLPGQNPAYTGYLPPALGGQAPDQSWIPVNGPATTPAGGAVEITVTTKDGATTTVTAVAGQDARFDLTVGGERVEVDIDGDGDGRVRPA